MKYLEALINRKDLTVEESKELLDILTMPETTPIQIAAILTALSSKGESESEIAGFIQGMREKMQTIRAEDAIDVCGTGGDKSNTFNISTAVAFVVAGAGVKVAKHGNRAASSKCGSADVLEALKIHIMLTPQQAEEVLNRVGMVFLFAPLYHSSFKQVGAVRKELRIRTIFNFLGPFVSPAKVARQIVGVPDMKMARKLAKAVQKLNYEHLAILVASDGLDEITLDGKTIVLDVQKDKVREYFMDPQKFGFTRSPKEKLKGGSPAENSEIIENILQGERGLQQNIVVLNSALALMVAGKAKTIEEGIRLAEESINSGKALEVLKKLQKETQKYA